MRDLSKWRDGVGVINYCILSALCCWVLFLGSSCTAAVVAQTLIQYLGVEADYNSLLYSTTHIHIHHMFAIAGMICSGRKELQSSTCTSLVFAILEELM